MSSGAGVRLTLTDEQVAHVAREVSGEGGLAALLSGVSDTMRFPADTWEADDTDFGRCSRSLLRGLLLLCMLPADGSVVALTEVARRLGASPSTTHRYLSTLVLVGLVEQDVKSRRYRRPRVGGDG